MRKHFRKVQKKKLVWVLLQVLLFECSCGENYNRTVDGNDAQYRITNEKLDSDDLRKLGYSKDEGSKRKPFPEELLNEVWKLSERFDDADETEERTQVKKFIIHAKKASNSKCHNCIKFSRRLPSIYRRVMKADLWIYLNYTKRNTHNKASVKIYNIDESNRSKTLIARTDLRKNENGWHKVLVNNINIWTNLKESYIEVEALLQIVCLYCSVSTEDHSLPYAGLVAEMTIKQSLSVKKCTVNSTTCCLDDFDIQLREYIKPLAGDIIWPKNINVGLCRGPCNNIHEGNFPHSALVNAVKLEGLKESKRKHLCCVPKKYISISTIIDEGNGFLVAKSIHDLVVDECTCA